MSILAMAHPTPHAPFKRELAWEDARSSDYASSRPRTEPERVALPSIRQAFPELHLRVENVTRTPSSTTSPVVGPGGMMTPPEYVHSPNQNKRRRLSIEDDIEMERTRRMPRIYTSPRDLHRQDGRPSSPTVAPRSATESWSSSRTSPYLPTAGSLPSMRSPVAVDLPDRVGTVPTLPSLPHLNFERAPAPMPRVVRGRSFDDYPQEAPRTVLLHQNGGVVESPALFTSGGGYPYGSHHPTRVQSLSLGSVHAFDRTPFSAGGYGQPYPEYMRIGELGSMGLNGDNKQRKRRGNLPKETTDKLRAWFVTHLHHPYPTEDEKQDLMRQTGLQMNQISNWFINARRRQLPTMINNARAESDAMSSGRGVDGSKVLPSTERAEYDDLNLKRDGIIALSDGEASSAHFDDNLESLKRRRAASMKRGSV